MGHRGGIMNRLAAPIVVVHWLGASLALAAPQAPEASPEPRAAVAVPAPAGEPVPAVATGSLQAHRLTGAIQIDGRLDEDAWRDAAFAGEFLQEAPHYGQAATSPTEVRVLYDDQYLYVGARMHHAGRNGEV